MSETADGKQPPVTRSLEQWKTHWRSQGQGWRTEPEIDVARQEELVRLRTTETDRAEGIYPFKDIVLSRADIEWLLATHESEGMYGPINHRDERQWRRRGIDISGANLSRVNLSHLPLARMNGSLSTHEITASQQVVLVVNMERTDLTGAHLEEAQLTGAQLKRANFTGAYLEEAQLDNAHLEEARLDEAHLEEADLSRAHLTGAHLIRVHGEESSFRDSHLEGANLSEAHLEAVDFRGAYIKRARFTRAHMEIADLRKAHVDRGGADFRLAHLEGANVREAHLEHADFSEASLEGADFSEAYLEDASFSKTHLEGVDFEEAHLEGVDFMGAHLEGKRLKSADLGRIRSWSQHFPEVVAPADLREAFLSTATRFKDATLGDGKHGFISIADVRWGDVNLNVIDWDLVPQIGDERRAKTRDRTKKEKAIQVEEYRAAVRANRQLAVVLQSQGLNEVAARFSYKAQVLQRGVFLRQRKFGQYLLSLFLDLLAGYGYRPVRSFLAYLIVVCVFMVVYHIIAARLSWMEAFIVSVTTFGRGLTPGTFSPDDPVAFASIFEAFIGLIVEATFIAALTQRFFGK